MLIVYGGLNASSGTLFLHMSSGTGGAIWPPPDISGSGNPVNLLFGKVINHALRSLHTNFQVKISAGSGDNNENVSLYERV